MDLTKLTDSELILNLQLAEARGALHQALSALQQEALNKLAAEHARRNEAANPSKE